MANRFHLASFIVPSLLGAQAVLLAIGACVNSPTFNEPGHLAAGLSVWRLGRFDAYKVNPPLVRIIAAAPLLMSGVETDWRNFQEGPNARPEFALGEDFVAANGERSARLFTLARWACIPFGLIGGAICYLWARDLHGRRAGLIALTLWCTCPSVTAHAQLITPDAASASLGLASCYAFWRWLRNPTAAHTLISGLTLGLAELSKTSLLILYAAWPVMWLAYECTSNVKIHKYIIKVSMIFSMYLISIYVICTGYSFEGTFLPLKDYTFVSSSLSSGHTEGDGSPCGGLRSEGYGNRFVGNPLAWLPVPLPRDYILGIDQQKQDLERGKGPAYLCGEFSDSGWWYYHIYAIAIKTPASTLLLLALAATRFAWQGLCLGRMASRGGKGEVRPEGEGANWRDEFIVLFPAAAFLAFLSANDTLCEHSRYALPVVGFIYVYIGRLSFVFNRTGPPFFASIVAVAIAWSVISSMSVYPHSLSYFNEIVGGPDGGPDHLINSNIDWGQDLYNLKRWVDCNPDVKPLNLAYFGYFDPRQAGIRFTLPDDFIEDSEVDPSSPISPGWYAISVNFVKGLPRFAYHESGKKVYLSRIRLAKFRSLKPVQKCGYSIYIYNVK